MTEWLAQVTELPAALLGAAFGLIMMLDSVPLLGVLIPADVAILATVGTSRPVVVSVTLVGVVGGCWLGWSASFLAGRVFGGRIRRGRIGAWIGEARWAAAERGLRREGGRMLMVTPFLPVLNALVPLAAGGLRMRYRDFMPNAAIGAVLWGGSYVALGLTARQFGGLLPGQSFTTIATVVIGLAVSWVVLLAARRRFATEPAPAA